MKYSLNKPTAGIDLFRGYDIVHKVLGARASVADGGYDCIKFLQPELESLYFGSVCDIAVPGEEEFGEAGFGVGLQ